MGAGLGWWGYDVTSSLWQFWPLILVFGFRSSDQEYNFLCSGDDNCRNFSGAFVYITLFNQANNLGWGMRTRSRRQKKVKFQRHFRRAESTKVVVETGAVDFNINGGTKELLSGESISNIASPKLSVETEESSEG